MRASLTTIWSNFFRRDANMPLIHCSGRFKSICQRYQDCICNINTGMMPVTLLYSISKSATN